MNVVPRELHEYLRFNKLILGYDGCPNLFFANGRNALLTRDYPSALKQLADAPERLRQLAAQAARDLPVQSWADIAVAFARVL